MIRIALRSFTTFLIAATLAASAFGQGYPLPARTPNTPVVCDPAVWPGCIESNAGRITPGWDLPIANYTGRFLDSTITRSYQQAFRTARAIQIRVAPNRFYLISAGTVLAYDIDHFFTRLAAGEVMVPSTQIPVTGTWRSPPPAEVLLRWDQFFNAEGSSWTTPVTDGFQRLMDVDYDDRGYLYLAYSEFKWGVVKDDFNIGGNWMTSAYQSYPYSGNPSVVIAVKTSDGKYYAVIPTGLTSQVWFMGDANGLQHVRKPDVSVGISRWTKSSDGTRLALVGRDGVIRIYRNDDLVNNGPALGVFSANAGRYTDVTSDGTNFFAVWSQSGVTAGMTVFARSGDSYVPATYTFPWNYGVTGEAPVPFIAYGGNVIAINGYEPANGGTWNIHLFQLTNLVPSEIKDRNNNSTRYFAQYYSGADTFLRPGNSSIFFAQPYKHNGKVYLIVGSYGIADVYELAAGSALSARVKSPAAGPYYGDKITFTTAAPSNPTVNWNFGDGTTASVGPLSPGYPDIDHSYAGRTEATLPASFTVVATNAADPTATDILSLTLKAPQTGFIVKNHPELLFRQPDASSPAPIVTGDQFVDAGDGTAAGHYVDWSSAALGSVQTAAGGAVGVGACGAYQLIYTAHYGPFSPVPPYTISAGNDAKYSINSFNYAVRPFSYGVTRTVSQTTMTFSAVLRLGSVDDLSGGGGTVASYVWELMNANNTLVDTMSGSATLGSIPQYIATQAKLVNAPMHLRLTVTAPSGLSPACAGFNRVISTLDFDGTLIPPPGACGSINDTSAYIGFYGSTTGCTPAHNTCSASDSLAFSLYGQNGWVFSCEPFTYAWNFGDGQTGAVKEPLHSFTSNGTFPVSVVITDGSNKSATIRGTVIVGGSPPPNPNPPPNPGGCATLTSQSAYIGFYGSTTGCTPASQSCNTGDYITFSSYAQNGYSFTCAPYTYLWNFGDGQTSTLAQPSHQYASGSTYNVTLMIQDSQGHSASISGPVHVAGSPGVNPGPNPNPTPGACAPITPTSAYVGFYGGGTGCTPANSICTSAETIAFTLYPQNGYSFTCTPYAYLWNFGDNKTSTDEQPMHQFAGAGTYNINVSVRDNSGQSTTISGTIKVDGGSGGTPPPGSPPPHRHPSGRH